MTTLSAFLSFMSTDTTRLFPKTKTSFVRNEETSKTGRVFWGVLGGFYKQHSYADKQYKNSLPKITFY